MAQLIKLKDYISRYEWDLYRYPTQFIRVKKQNWKKLYEMWSNPVTYTPDIEFDDYIEVERPSKFAKWKAFIKKETNQEQENEANPKQKLTELPETEEELKHYFLDKILNFQLKWATSTVNRISYVHKKYYTDPLLKYLLQRFPDTYLLMYTPVFNVKDVPIDSEILLVSPIGIEILYFIEEDDQAVIMAGNERVWTVERNNETFKILNPNIALKRTEQIIKSILLMHEIEFPVYKTVISRTNSILFTNEPYQTKIVGKKEYPTWFHDRRKLISTLKSNQLKAAEALLRHCQSTSVQRPEWDDDISIQTIGDLEDL
ncbi:hypothetical protein [Oceanobacillus sp. Castelsardo]|uniref:hypothetical protein n=1 Tax=Oceanobacillus sp. Castelsardo TaxID=1851204 RepID=UPI0008388707|nr:hypothetical protein [Oceanobacillus sp. Castelsardo]